MTAKKKTPDVETPITPEEASATPHPAAKKALASMEAVAARNEEVLAKVSEICAEFIRVFDDINSSLKAYDEYFNRLCSSLKEIEDRRMEYVDVRLEEISHGLSVGIAGLRSAQYRALEKMFKYAPAIAADNAEKTVAMKPKRLNIPLLSPEEKAILMKQSPSGCTKGGQLI